MILLKQYENLIDAENMASKLEKKGILAHVSSKNSYLLSRHMTGAIKVGLWIVLEKQYDDAESLLKNPKHKITTALPKDEFINLKKTLIKDTKSKILKVSAVILIILALIISLMVHTLTP